MIDEEDKRAGEEAMEDPERIGPELTRPIEGEEMTLGVCTI